MPYSAPSDAFIGRHGELQELGRRLAAGERLITLLGPPGIGKTRLALEYLRRRGKSGRERNLFCALAEVRDAAGLCARVSQELGVRAVRPAARAAKASVETLASALDARGSLLVVLDNFEQLVETGAEALSAWLAAAPGLRLVVTSRERLRIESESVFELQPLGLPTSADDPEQAEAMQLFAERARSASPGFTVHPGNAATVARLVQKLDGIPLAIELAAARVDVVGLSLLEERLPGNLDVLAHGKRNAPARQATMRGAVQWSWDLLSRPEQRALMCCSLFRGGFSLLAAESVLMDQSAAPSSSRTLDLIHSLSDKSLVHKIVSGGEDVRFDLYVGIREFAEEQLGSSGFRDEAEARHVSYFQNEAAFHSQELERTGSASALAWFGAERSNLVAAYDYAWRGASTDARARSSIEAATDIVLALEPVLVAKGPIDQLLELVNRVLVRAEFSALSAARRARALRARAKAMQLSGLVQDAEQDLVEALDLAQIGADRALSAALLAELGVLHHLRRQTDSAKSFYDRALVIHRELGDPRQQARTLGNLGALCHDLVELERADEYYAQALALFRRLDEPRWEGIFMTNRGILEQEQGRFAAARTRYAEALERLDLAADRRLLGITVGNLGVLEHECGNLEAAHARHLSALEHLRQVGDVHSEALCLARIGATHAALGRPREARKELAAAERLLGAFSDSTLQKAVQLHYAFLDLASEDCERDALERVRQRMQHVRTAVGDEGRSAADLSDDVRSTLRILESALRAAFPLEGVLGKLPSEALVVGPDSAWFRPPHGRLQDLRKYATTRRILHALVSQCRQTPKGELAVDALLEAGWPGERLDYRAGINRVHVALADLRKRGLKQLLIRTEQGYKLSETLCVEMVSEALPDTGDLPSA